MKNTLLHVPRLALAAALLGAVVSPRAASAQSELDTSEAEAFIGTWILVSESGGPNMDLKIEDQGGKVAAIIRYPGQPVHNVTDITRSGAGLVLSYEPVGLGPASLTLTMAADGATFSAAFVSELFSQSGTGTRVSQ